MEELPAPSVSYRARSHQNKNYAGKLILKRQLLDLFMRSIISSTVSATESNVALMTLRRPAYARMRSVPKLQPLLYDKETQKGQLCTKIHVETLVSQLIVRGSTCFL